MKKQITITEMSLVTRTIEVEVPSYYNRYSMFVAITDEAVIKVYDDGQFYVSTSSANQKRYNEEIADVLKGNPPAVSKKLFEKHLQKTIKCLTEQYQLSMSMILDPNTQTAEGQQAEETAALESASQDTAMEATDSEEGSTEG